MNFTPKNFRTAISAFLTIAVVGLIGWVIHVSPAPVPIVATQDTNAMQQSSSTSYAAPVVPAVELTPAIWQEAGQPSYYQPVSSWYKSKHWWKRNAPIVGGAGGGALVGGLIGGGPGALIGGAAGGGGGYLYKRSRHHHHRYK
jgi:hypothetical protein